MSIVRNLLPELLLGLAATAGSAQTLSIVSGNGQIVCQLCFAANNKSTYDPLVVKVTDAAGRPLPNATVNWALSAGSGFIGANQTTTDASGLTSVQFSPPFLNQGVLPFIQGAVTASIGGSAVTFTETLAVANAQSPATLPIIFTVGSTFVTGSSGQTQPFSVFVSTQQGSPVSGVAVTLGTDDPAGGPTVACQSQPGNPPGTVLTDASGSATCMLQFGPKVGVDATFKVIIGGGYQNSGPITLNVTVGPAGLLKIARGDQQQATASGTNLPSPLVAQVTDLGGNAVADAAVTWTLDQPAAATLFNSGSTSASNGEVSTNVRIASPSGPFHVIVSLRDNPTISVSFTVTASAVTISGLSVISGNNQDAGQNAAFGAPLVVQAIANGAPAAGIPIGFTVTSGSATLSAASAVTNSQGQAQVNATAGPNVGAVVVTASAGNQSATFNLTVRPPGPSFTSDSFLNGASQMKSSAQAGGISPCSIATIQASGIATGIQGVVAPPLGFGPLPYKVAGVTVTFGSSPAPIFNLANVSNQESVTVQVPCDIPAGNTTVTVNVGGTPKSASTVVKPASPGIFETVGADGVRRGILVRLDGSYVDPTTNPARRDEKVRMYATGLGAVSCSVVTNGIPIEGSDCPVLGTPIVGVNNSGVQVESAKLAPGLIGVYEVTFVVPALASGNYVLSLALDPADHSPTQYSQGSTISIQ